MEPRTGVWMAMPQASSRLRAEYLDDHSGRDSDGDFGREGGDGAVERNDHELCLEVSDKEDGNRQIAKQFKCND